MPPGSRPWATTTAVAIAGARARRGVSSGGTRPAYGHGPDPQASGVTLAGMRALVVVNHRATTTSRRTRDVLLAALRHDLKLDVEETGHRGHAVELAREARRDGLDLVVVFGGDGTVNEVVNGLLDGASGHRVPDLAIVPGGSTNVLARNLGLPEDPVEATGLVLDAVPLAPPHAVGARPARREVVHLLRGVGFDADVIRRVEEQRERGKRSTVGLYTRAAIRRFFAQEDRSEGQIVLECDGVDPVSGISLAVVTNCAPWTYLGGRPLNPTPRASFDTGLDLFAVRRLGIASTLRHLAEITLSARRGARGRDVILLHDQAGFTLSSPRPEPVQVDGDFLGERSTMTLRSQPRRCTSYSSGLSDLSHYCDVTDMILRRRAPQRPCSQVTDLSPLHCRADTVVRGRIYVTPPDVVWFRNA